jgi:hypothetical protein
VRQPLQLLQELQPPKFILPSSPLPLPQFPLLHAFGPQAPVWQVPVWHAPVWQPPRVWWCKHPVLNTSKPANDPIHNQRFIADILLGNGFVKSPGHRDRIDHGDFQ